MSFTLPDLPFDPNEFGPTLTAQSFEGHHQSHHGGVVKGSNDIVAREPALQGRSLEAVIKLAAGNPQQEKLFFNTAPVSYTHLTLPTKRIV